MWQLEAGYWSVLIPTRHVPSTAYPAYESYRQPYPSYLSYSPTLSKFRMKLRFRCMWTYHRVIVSGKSSLGFEKFSLVLTCLRFVLSTSGFKRGNVLANRLQATEAAEFECSPTRSWEVSAFAIHCIRTKVQDHQPSQPLPYHAWQPIDKSSD